LFEKLKEFALTQPLLLAIIIDLIKILPYVDLPFSEPLEAILWSEQGNMLIGAINMGYNLVGDIFAFGDIFPLNTVCVLGLMITGGLKKTD